MSTVKELQLTVPHDARSVTVSIIHGDHQINQHVDIGDADAVALVRAPKPKAPLPEWHKSYIPTDVPEGKLRQAAYLIETYFTWRMTQDGHEYWSDVKNKLEAMADEMAAYIRDSK